MGPNDAELVRVYTKQLGGCIAAVTFPYDKDVEVVVEANTGDAVFASGGYFELKVFVRNLRANGGQTDPALVPLMVEGGTERDIATIAGSLSVDWKTPGHRFNFLISASSLGKEKNGAILEVVASLQVGRLKPNASFCTSEMFMIHRP